MRAFLVLLALIIEIFALDLMQLSVYKNQNINGYLVSEKLDGIRAYWDGKQLLSRKGNIIVAPNDFLSDFPPFALDGELYAGINSFEKTQSIVMDRIPDKILWKEISYNIFDVPTQEGGLLQRLNVLKKYISKVENIEIMEQSSAISMQKDYVKLQDRLKIIPQHIIKNEEELEKFMSNVLKKGGEGVVIREPNAPYIPTRSELNLKYKQFFDAECKVMSYNAGRGKFKGLVGSINCELDDGKIFKIGSGLSDEIRANPPEIGSMITFKYQNLTKNGLPRFAIYLRQRED